MDTKETRTHAVARPANYRAAPVSRAAGAEPEARTPTDISEGVAKDVTVGTNLNPRLHGPRPLSRPELAAAKRRLTAWARSIPHHEFESFGDEIEILSATYSPSFRVRLATLYESRSASIETQPYDGGSLPDRKTDETNVKPWSYPLQIPDEVAQTEESFYIPDSQVVYECHPCKASGREACDGCSGSGMLHCAACGACGHVLCSRCSGLGAISVPTEVQRHENFTEHRTVTKYRQDGTAYHELEPYNAIRVRQDTVMQQVRCPGCSGDGAVKCDNCAGHGNVKCIQCGGAGNQACENCFGKGRLLNFIVIRSSFRPAEHASLCHDPGALTEVTDELNIDSDFKAIASLKGIAINLNDFKEIQHAALTGLLKSAVSDANANLGTGEKICLQTLHVLRADVAIIRYRFEGREYEIFLCGHDLRIVAPSSPIGRIAREIFSNAARRLDTGNPILGLDLLHQAAQMDRQNKRINSLIAALRAKLADSHLAVAKQIYDDGRWLESLYHSSRARLLFPADSRGCAHERRVRLSILLLYLGPASALMATGVLAALLTGEPMLFLGATSAIACGAASLYGAGTSLQKNLHAAAVSTATAALALVAVITAVFTRNPAAAILAAVGVPAGTWMTLRLARRRSPPQTTALPDEGPTAEIARTLRQQLVVDWPYIEEAFAELPGLSTYSGRWQKEIDMSSARQERRTAASTDALEIHRQRLRKSVSGSAEIFAQIAAILRDCAVARHRGDISGLNLLAESAQRLGPALCKKLTETERAAKQRSVRASVDHSPGAAETVVAELARPDSRFFGAIHSIRSFATLISGMSKRPSLTLADAAEMLPKAERALELLEKSLADPT